MADDAILSLDNVEALNDTDYIVVPVPRWNGSIRLGSLDGEQLIDWSEKNEDKETAKIAGLRLLALSMVDAEGNRVGSDEKVSVLKKKNPKIVAMLCQKALEINGLAAKNDVERKNDSGEATSAASPIA